jgi:hypothetical protein
MTSPRIPQLLCMPHVLSDDIGGDFLKITYTNGIRNITKSIKFMRIFQMVFFDNPWLPDLSKNH